MCLSSLRSGSQTSETKSATEECAPRLATGLRGLSAPGAALGVETHRPNVRPHSHTASPFCAPKSLGPCKDTCPWSGGHRNPAGPRLLRQRCENRVSKRGHIRRRVGFARGCTSWLWGSRFDPEQHPGLGIVTAGTKAVSLGRGRHPAPGPAVTCRWLAASSPLGPRPRPPPPTSWRVKGTGTTGDGASLLRP